MSKLVKIPSPLNSYSTPSRFSIDRTCWLAVHSLPTQDKPTVVSIGVLVQVRIIPISARDFNEIKRIQKPETSMSRGGP